MCIHQSTGAWLNIAEIELSLLKRLGIAKRVGTQGELEKQIENYKTKRNAKQVKVNWQFTTKDARVKLKRLYPSYDWKHEIGLYDKEISEEVKEKQEQ